MVRGRWLCNCHNDEVAIEYFLDFYRKKYPKKTVYYCTARKPYRPDEVGIYIK